MGAPPPRVYFDVSCLARPFDDQSQLRIQSEARAVQHLLRRALAGELVWVSSDVVSVEIAETSDIQKRRALETIHHQAQVMAVISDRVASRADLLVGLGFGPVDALHLACAESGLVDVFFTTDDRLIRVARRLETTLRIVVSNPVQWL